MTTIPEDSERRTIGCLVASVIHAKGAQGRAEGHLDAVHDAIVHAMWRTEAAARAGVETMPTAEVAVVLRRLFDIATLGRALPKEKPHS